MKNQNTPVVLLHCSGGDNRYWAGLDSYLGSSFQTLTPNFIGYGVSPKFPAEEKNSNTDLQHIKTLLQSLDKPCHLVGHSYGGAIALELATIIPEKIESLTLIEPVAFFLLDSPESEGVLGEFISIGEHMKHCVAKQDFFAAAQAFLSYWQSLAEWQALPIQVQQRLALLMPKIIDEFEAIRCAQATWKSLAALQMPIHFIKGSATRPIIHCLLDNFLQAVPSASFSVVEGAGHMLPISHKAEVFQLITRFIQTQEQEQQEQNSCLDLAS